MSSLLLTSSTGAAVAFGTTVFGKLYMSFAHRIVAAFKGPKVGAAHMLEQSTKEDHATQMNEAEYAPLICAALFFLASKSVDAPLATTLAVAGNTGYLCMRFAFGIRLWTTTPFASMRYMGMILLTKAIYEATST